MPALPVHHTATVDTPWDGPAAVAAMPNDDEVLEYCHAWQSAEAASTPHRDGDDDADDKKSNYAFPHHLKKGGPANIPGCNNGKARLKNSNIPEADKPGVEKHLQAHIDDAKKDDKSSDATQGPLVAMRLPGERSVDMVALAAGAGWQNALRLGQMTDTQRVQACMPRVHRLSNRTEWHRIADFTDGTPARVDLFDEIGFWGVTAADFLAQLNAIQAPSIELHINSPGGDVWDGIAILNMLRSHNKPIDVVIDGMAASAASFIAQAGDTVTMMPNSQMMIHDAWGMCIGNAEDMAETSEILNKGSANIANVYATRSGKPADEWRTAMRVETWYSAEEAVQAGLADRVGDLRRGQKAPDADGAPENRWNLSFYAHSGRADAPSPVVPAAPHTPAPPVLADVAPVTVSARAGIDPEVVRAAFRDAFRTSPKEARQ